MRLIACVLCAVAMSLPAADLVSYRRSGNALRLELSNGAAEVEWISTSSFRFFRSWQASGRPARQISNPAISFDIEDTSATLRLLTRYVTVEIQKAGIILKVSDAKGKLLLEELAEITRADGSIVLERAIAPAERFFGLGVRTSAQLDLRGEIVRAERPVLVSSSGYGLSHVTPAGYIFDLGKTMQDRCRLAIENTDTVEYFFYYGPSPKEVLEEHLKSTRPVSRFALSDMAIRKGLSVPKDATLLPVPLAPTWGSLADSVRRVLHASYSAILVSAFDLGPFASVEESLFRCAVQFAALMPIVRDSQARNRSSRQSGILEAQARLRRQWAPYLLSYLEDARERGLPVIRPLGMQFPADERSLQCSDQFMVGDEILVAPLYTDGASRNVYLPMGVWTDLRSNRVVKGRQSVSVEAQHDGPPMFARNGSIIPLVSADAPGPMALHYFPRLGAEFFLIEPEQSDYTQFHAAPAGALMRLEIESKVDRDYEWIVHHADPVSGVTAGTQEYAEAGRAESLRAGTWFYDAEAKNLHVRVRVNTGQDLIVNIAFR